MAFFEKVENIAKNIGDRTGDAIEITKLNAKISGAKSAIAEEEKKLGHACYEKHAAGESLAEDLLPFCAAIDEQNRLIREAQDEIERIRAENAQQKEPAPAPVRLCASCGAALQQGVKFCPACGVKVEAPASPGSCPSCGASITADAKFCPDCGAKLS